ncbi:MAG TPA: uracil-DNA glycosylase [Dehalococcoidia bacterium]|nr:uracil-DNA glycosylase [Dehalococcoidia bacterium]
MNHVHVLGEVNGPLDADVLFVAEAPGRLGAARTGVPMTSDVAGRRFQAFLAEAGLERGRVFITNAVLCNPLDIERRNRRPLRSEVDRCLPFLREQIKVVRPEVAVALGEVALDALGRIEAHGLRLRDGCGVAIDWHGRRLVALYHPGRRALVHRDDLAQRDDWRQLGALFAAQPPAIVK